MNDTVTAFVHLQSHLRSSVQFSGESKGRYSFASAAIISEIGYHRPSVYEIKTGFAYVTLKEQEERNYDQKPIATLLPLEPVNIGPPFPQYQFSGSIPPGAYDEILGAMGHHAMISISVGFNKPKTMTGKRIWTGRIFSVSINYERTFEEAWC